MLEGSSAVVRGGFVLVDSTNAMFGELIRQQIHQKPLVEAVRKVTGKPYKVGIFKRSLAPPKISADPFDEIIRNASEAGIGITEN
jgi:DNA polymerase-3 subunit gamma/tau